MDGQVSQDRVDRQERTTFAKDERALGEYGGCAGDLECEVCWVEGGNGFLKGYENKRLTKVL